MTGFGNTILKSFFLSAQTGHAACMDGKIMKTVDGGTTWYVTASVNASPAEYKAIIFVNQNIGFASREHDDVLKTTDGGQTWQLLPNGPGQSIYSFYFINTTTGYAGGEHGALFKTSDGGNSWININPDNAYIEANHIYGLYFNEATGFAVGGRGRILKTTNGGATWSKYAPTYQTITKLEITSSNEAVAVAGNTFFKTTDTGETWQEAGSIQNSYNSVYRMDFISPQTGFAVCGEMVYKTNNGGQNWTILPNSEIDEGIYTIDFIDENTGYIGGGFNFPKYKKTTDGGITWQTLGNIRFGEIQFTSPSIGYARNTGGSYIFYKTVDAGLTWTNILQLENDDMSSFHFVDDNTGYVVGEPGIAYKTTDGGATWTTMTMPYEYFEKIRFINAENGYASADYGKLYKTTDGGNVWLLVGTFPEITDITFKDSYVYLAGLYGLILRSDTGVLANDGLAQETASNVVIYPNPATTQLTIATSNNQKISLVNIYDITGRRILALTPEAMDCKIDLTNKSKGIYIASVTLDDDTIISQKFVLN